eukprot:6214235-Pleurochrysis_carterae.AAC.2
MRVQATAACVVTCSAAGPNGGIRKQQAEGIPEGGESTGGGGGLTLSSLGALNRLGPMRAGGVGGKAGPGSVCGSDSTSFVSTSTSPSRPKNLLASHCVLTGDTAGRLALWHVSEPTVAIRAVQAHTSAVVNVVTLSYADKGDRMSRNLVVSASLDGTIRIYM